MLGLFTPQNKQTKNKETKKRKNKTKTNKQTSKTLVSEIGLLSSRREKGKLLPMFYNVFFEIII